jgi:hypothetical protein
MAVSVEGLSPHVQAMHRRVKEIIEQYILPLEAEVHQAQARDKWTVHPRIEELKVRKQYHIIRWLFG